MFPFIRASSAERMDGPQGYLVWNLKSCERTKGDIESSHGLNSHVWEAVMILVFEGRGDKEFSVSYLSVLANVLRRVEIDEFVRRKALIHPNLYCTYTVVDWTI